MSIISWAKYHRAGLLSGASLLFGAGAVAASFIESPKTHEDWAEGKKALGLIKEKRVTCSDTYSEEQYKKDLRKETINMVTTGAKNMKFTIILESLAIGTGIAGIAVGASQISSLTALATSATAALAFNEDAIRDIWGEEGLQKVREKKMTGVKKTVKEVNPETGKIEEKEIVEYCPDLAVLDANAAELISKLPPEAQAAFDLAHCVVIDEENENFRACNGNIDLLVPALKNALNQSNIQMWNSDFMEIRLRHVISNLGFRDLGSERWNKSLLKNCGTIDSPTAYSWALKRNVKIKGFNDDGICTERYGEMTHKSLSFGEEQDRYLFSTPEMLTVDNPYFIVDGKLILDLSYDGIIEGLDATGGSKERKMSAWKENPISEK